MIEKRPPKALRRPPATDLAALQEEISRCRQCPRLVAHREAVVGKAPRRLRGQQYWARPAGAFGDPDARLLILGSAPGAHGANRTGRMFTGSHSGDWLFAALHHFGYGNQPEGWARDDGLLLRRAYVSSVNRCVPPDDKPTRQEQQRCRPYLVRELELLPRLCVVLALGRIAFDGFLAAWKEMEELERAPRPCRFSHGAHYRLGRVQLLACYHPSQRNTATGRLTREMFHAVFAQADQLLRTGSGGSYSCKPEI